MQHNLRSKRFRRVFHRSRHFSLFGGAKIGASATNGRRGVGEGAYYFALASIFERPKVKNV